MLPHDDPVVNTLTANLYKYANYLDPIEENEKNVDVIKNRIRHMRRKIAGLLDIGYTMQDSKTQHKCILKHEDKHLDLQSMYFSIDKSVYIKGKSYTLLRAIQMLLDFFIERENKKLRDSQTD